MVDPKRRRAFQRGMEAESQVRAFYEAAGFECLAERHKTKNGEVDVIMRRSNEVAFIEVKARPSLMEAAEAVTVKSQRRIAAAAAEFIAANVPDMADIDTFRFDVACVLPGGHVEIIENAFEAMD